MEDEPTEKCCCLDFNQQPSAWPKTIFPLQVEEVSLRLLVNHSFHRFLSGFFCPDFLQIPD